MADVHSAEVRSYNMGRIRSKDTRPEMIVRKYLFSHGYRYRLHDRKLAGKPDIVLKKFRTAIFIHGCFWHGHEGCKYFVIPKTRTEWWMKKIGVNIQNDDKNLNALKQAGWHTIVIWECELKNDKMGSTLENLIRQLSI